MLTEFPRSGMQSFKTSILSLLRQFLPTTALFLFMKTSVISFSISQFLLRFLFLFCIFFHFFFFLFLFFISLLFSFFLPFLAFLFCFCLLSWFTLPSFLLIYFYLFLLAFLFLFWLPFFVFLRFNFYSSLFPLYFS